VVKIVCSQCEHAVTSCIVTPVILMKRNQEKALLRGALSVFDLGAKLPRRQRIQIAAGQRETGFVASSSWDRVWSDLNAAFENHSKARDTSKG
jgi:hypothetical protein